MVTLVRLQRYLAAAGVAARRKAEELITAGRVKVNGEVVRVLGTKVDPAELAEEPAIVDPALVMDPAVANERGVDPPTE